MRELAHSLVFTNTFSRQTKRRTNARYHTDPELQGRTEYIHTLLLPLSYGFIPISSAARLVRNIPPTISRRKSRDERDSFLYCESYLFEIDSADFYFASWNELGLS